MRALGVARRSEALLRVAFAAIDAYEALKAQRAVLDYDDLIERTSELLAQAGQDRVGALQAGRAHRPCPGRRGPGHQPAPVGDRAQADRGVLRRRRRARRARDPCSWSATRSSRSTASRVPTSPTSARVRERLTARAAAAGRPIHARAARPVVPVGARGAGDGRRGVRAAGGARRRGRPGPDPAPRHRARQRPRAWSSCGRWPARRRRSRPTSPGRCRARPGSATSPSAASHGRSPGRSATGWIAARCCRAPASRSGRATS